ncbi:MAG: biotin--protein ligase [Candidatus Diapherotrites archaeon]|nr:biotin--protein ligase [Candidatus Diapherotrites archaeon]
MKVAAKKVSGGKLVRVKVDISDGRIASAKIEGDFFLHPESGVELLEASLLGTTILATDNELISRLTSVKDANSLDLVGFSVEDVVDVLKSALRSE